MKIVCNKHTKRNDIVKLIRKIMIDRDIKKVNIAHAIGQTEQTVSNLLNPNYRSNSSMTVDQMAMICEAMGCKLVIDIVPAEKVNDGNKD